jgi:CheY-like chemotaxis protein
MNPRPVDLNAVVDGMSSLLHSTLGGSVEIRANLAEGLWPALADAAQIELVLLNLAINARDAMPERGTIAISTGNVTLGPPSLSIEPPPGDYAMVAVADTGTGIPAPILDKVFDPFFTTKEIGKGSGLGLSQVLGVAQQLGGGVRIETLDGAGTTVTVFLPRAEAAADRPPQPSARRTAGVAPGARPTAGILLVDDDADVRAVAAAMLRDAGHTVIEAGSGGAALERLGRDEPHIEILIADIAMPGMSGFELARAVRQGRPDLPILFVTGFADIARSEESRHETVLQKPFRAEELTAKVAEALT